MRVKKTKLPLPSVLVRARLRHTQDHIWTARSWTPELEAATESMESPIHKMTYSLTSLSGYLGRTMYIMAALEAFGLKEDTVVLDVGCGPPNLYALMCGSRWFVTYIGVDSQRKYMLRYPMSRNFIGVVGDAANLDFVESNSIDFVVFSEVLEHITESQGLSALEEVTRVCRPGGWLVVSTPNYEEGKLEKEAERTGHKFYWEHDVLERTFRELGLRVLNADWYLLITRRIRSDHVLKYSDPELVRRLLRNFPKRIVATILADAAGPVAAGAKWVLQKKERPK